MVSRVSEYATIECENSSLTRWSSLP